MKMATWFLGGVTAMFLGCGAAVAQDILSFGASWEYLNPLDGIDPAIADSDFATTWHTPAAYDGPAFSGPAPALLGYGSIGFAEILTDIGTPPSGKRYSAYFRTSVTTSQAYDRLRLDLLADDGGVLYIDGKMMERLNFSGTDNYLAPTDKLGNEAAPAILVLDERLEAGEHVIAFSVHNDGPTSSDLGFDLRIVPLGQPGALDYLAWTINDGEITITDTAHNVAGQLVIPGLIEGLPVTRIRGFAFESSLWSRVEIPDGVTSIGDSAFLNCADLTSVTIPDSVKVIGESAFLNCGELDDISLGLALESIGSRAFEGTALTFHSFGGLKYLFGTSAAYLVDGSAVSGDLVLSAELAGLPVRSINAFRSNTAITSVIIPDSVTSIGAYAFSDCSGLKNVTIPDTVKEIGAYAFYNCNDLTSVTIPGSVTEIGGYAFYNCKGLASVTIPGSVTEIGRNAFYSCTGLTSVTIPDGVNVIGDRAFQNCTGLTGVAIPGSVTEIGASAFYNCSVLTSVTIPDGVNVIGNGAFQNCDKLTSVAIPDSVTAVSASVFQDCNGLTSVTIPGGVTSIGASAFRNCTRLTSVPIPENVKEIGARAFYNCIGLTSVVIPGSVTDIGAYAFQDCNGLTSVTIPGSVTDIGASAFYDCFRLTSVTVSDGVKIIGAEAFSGCYGLTSMTIPGSVTTIGASAFAYCGGLTSVMISDSVTEISDRAFYNCGRLTSVTIPDGVTVIGGSAFAFCTGLTSVTIPDGVTVIGASAFQRCASLTSVTIPDGVTEIASSAFNSCTGLTSVTIPDRVTAIGATAFAYCNGLASVTFSGAAPAAVTPGAFLNVPSSARAFVKPQHAQSFGGVGANWHGLTVALISDLPGPISISEVSLSGNFFTILFSGEPAATGWRIVGSSGLGDFSDNFTAITVITETDPGQYEAVIDITGKPANCFLRVER